jgi:hypothetical protein
MNFVVKLNDKAITRHRQRARRPSPLQPDGEPIRINFTPGRTDLNTSFATSGADHYLIRPQHSRDSQCVRVIVTGIKRASGKGPQLHPFTVEFEEIGESIDGIYG